MSSVGAAPARLPSAVPAPRRAASTARSRPRRPRQSTRRRTRSSTAAAKHVVLPGEDAAAFHALEAACRGLAPEGALRGSVLARQGVVRAAWRRRGRRGPCSGETGRPTTFPAPGARSFDTLLRYRGGTLAELWRALRTLKALQAEAASRPHAMREVAPALPREPQTHAGGALEKPVEPESRGNPGESEPAPAASEPAQHGGEPAPAPASEPDPVPALALARLQRSPQPNEPRLGLAQAEAARRVRSAPGAIAPPRERLHTAASPAQPSRSTP